MFPLAHAPTSTPTPRQAPNPSPVPPPPGDTITLSGQQPIRPASNSPEFRRNCGSNEVVNGPFALDSGLTGESVSVRVIDQGANTPLSALNEPINPASSNGLMETSADASVFVAAGPFNPAQPRAILSNVMVLGALGSDYSGSIASMVIQPQVTDGQWLRRRVRQLNSGGGASLTLGGLSGSFGFAIDQVGPGQRDVRPNVTTGKVAFVEGGFEVRASWMASEDLQSNVTGLAPFAAGVLAYVPQASNSFAVDRHLNDGSKLGLMMAFGHFAGSNARAVTLGWSSGGTDLRVSLIDERGTLMGASTGSGALRLGRGATTAMVEMHRTFDLDGGWTLEGYGSFGVTRLKIDDASLVTGTMPILSSRIGIQASAPMFGGTMNFGIAQPLAIESGAATLSYGNIYNFASQSLTDTTANAGLAGQRQVMLTAGFSKGGARRSLRIGVGHDVGDGSVRALGSYAVRF